MKNSQLAVQGCVVLLPYKFSKRIVSKIEDITAEKYFFRAGACALSKTIGVLEMCAICQSQSPLQLGM